MGPFHVCLQSCNTYLRLQPLSKPLLIIRTLYDGLSNFPAYIALNGKVTKSVTKWGKKKFRTL